MRAFDDPTSRTKSGLLSYFLHFLAASANIGGKDKLREQYAHFLEVITFVHAQLLQARRSWRRSIKLEIIEHRLDPFHVMPVAAVNGERHRNAVRLSLSGWGQFFPRSAVRSSSHCPSPAKTS